MADVKELLVIELSTTTADAELNEKACEALAFRDAGGKRVGCCLSGFAHDPRPLAQIPSACAFFRRLWDSGFCSALHLSFWVPPTDAATENCLGAIEVWAFGHGLVRDKKLLVDAKKYKRFLRELKRSNDVLASRLEQAPASDLFAEFLAAYPEFRDQIGKPVRFPDGVTRPGISADAAEAFARWASANGKADQRKCRRFLDNTLPQIRDAHPPKEWP